MTGWVLGAAVAALAGTPHCVGMCGGLAIAAGGKGLQQLPYHLGRITTYATLGALSGAFGQALSGLGEIGTWVAAALLVAMAAGIAGFTPPAHVKIPGLIKLGSRLLQHDSAPARFAFGVVNGLLPCGLLYATLALPVAAGSAWQGAVIMTVFGLGTVPALSVAARAVRELLLRAPKLRPVMAMGVLVLGLFTLAQRGAWFQPDTANASCHASQEAP